MQEELEAANKRNDEIAAAVEREKIKLKERQVKSLEEEKKRNQKAHIKVLWQRLTQKIIEKKAAARRNLHHILDLAISTRREINKRLVREHELDFADIAMDDGERQDLKNLPPDESRLFRGTWHVQERPCPVAIKAPSVNQKRKVDDIAAAAAHEIKTNCMIQGASNIVQMFGWCRAPAPMDTSRFTVIMEAVSGETFEAALVEAEEKPPVSHRIAWLRGAAKGIKVLHSAIPTIVHGRLHGRNVMLTPVDGRGYRTAKICDFGLAAVTDQPFMDNSAAIWWKAPELYAAGAPQPSTKADVFSFAMLIYEALELQVPFHGVASGTVLSKITRHFCYDKERSLSRKAQLNEFLDDYPLFLRRPHLTAAASKDLPEEVFRGLKSVMTRCWKDDAEGRPTIETIVSELKELQQEICPGGNEPPVSSNVALNPGEIGPSRSCSVVASKKFEGMMEEMMKVLKGLANQDEMLGEIKKAIEANSRNIFNAVEGLQHGVGLMSGSVSDIEKRLASVDGKLDEHFKKAEQQHITVLKRLEDLKYQADDQAVQIERTQQQIITTAEEREKEKVKQNEIYDSLRELEESVAKSNGGGLVQSEVQKMVDLQVEIFAKQVLTMESVAQLTDSMSGLEETVEKQGHEINAARSTVSDTMGQMEEHQKRVEELVNKFDSDARQKEYSESRLRESLEKIAKQSADTKEAVNRSCERLDEAREEFKLFKKADDGECIKEVAMKLDKIEAKMRTMASAEMIDGVKKGVSEALNEIEAKMDAMVSTETVNRAEHQASFSRLQSVLTGFRESYEVHQMRMSDAFKEVMRRQEVTHRMIAELDAPKVPWLFAVFPDPAKRKKFPKPAAWFKEALRIHLLCNGNKLRKRPTHFLFRNENELMKTKNGKGGRYRGYRLLEPTETLKKWSPVIKFTLGALSVAARAAIMVYLPAAVNMVPGMEVIAGNEHVMEHLTDSVGGVVAGGLSSDPKMPHHGSCGKVNEEIVSKNFSSICDQILENAGIDASDATWNSECDDSEYARVQADIAKCWCCPPRPVADECP